MSSYFIYRHVTFNTNLRQMMSPEGRRKRENISTHTVVSVLITARIISGSSIRLLFPQINKILSSVTTCTYFSVDPPYLPCQDSKVVLGPL